MKIIIINGPNLNLLGKRETSIYGADSFENYFKEIQNEFNEVEFEYYQSNVEGELINKLHEIGFSANAIVMNAGAYTHTSIGIGDAIAGISTPVMEVHISNVYAREEYRHQSLMAKNCAGVITGLGLYSYRLAILHFLSLKK
jgi:3-dehydroquinate dehydratase-2